MKIALVVRVFPQVSETFIVSKALGLVDRGHDVHLVCGASPRANWDAFGPDHRVHELRDRVHQVPATDLQWSSVEPTARQLAVLARAPRAAVRRYRSHDASRLGHRLRHLLLDAPLVAIAPDVVHFEFGSQATSRMDIRDRLGTAVTVSFRGFDLNYVGLDHPDHYRPVWDGADGIHVLGQDLWRRAVRRGAPATLAHTVIPPAIDLTAIDPGPPRPGRPGTPGDPLRLVSVGRLHWKKGYEYALEAVALLRARGLTVEHRIIGDGELLGAVAFWRHQLALDDAVHLLRSVPPAEVARQLAWADVMVHAATSEGFCNAVIEAQAHGVPVACTDADGLPENVAHGESGIVVPRREPAKLADAIEHLAGDPEMRARMGAAGRSRVEQLFGLEDQLDAWEQFYDEAVERWRSKTPTRS